MLHLDKKRVRNGDVENEYEYLLRTFETLASYDYAYMEVFSDKTLDIWDRVFYSKQNSWAVVLGENGKILTSYKIRDDIIDTLEKHKKIFQSEYTRKVVSDEFSKRVTTIYERLTRV